MQKMDRAMRRSHRRIESEYAILRSRRNCPFFDKVEDMEKKGISRRAFLKGAAVTAVSAAVVFGDHLGFTAGYAPKMLVPVIVGKLTGGVTAVCAALLLTRGKAYGQSAA